MQEIYRIDIFKSLVKNPIRSEEYSSKSKWIESIICKNKELTPESYTYYRYNPNKNEWVQVAETDINNEVEYGNNRSAGYNQW